MRAKSTGLADTARRERAQPRGPQTAGAVHKARLPFEERRRQILRKAGEFFADYGLTAQTRSLAEACGISQRLLYRFFPTKGALIDEVYNDAILSPFKAVWLAQLRDRSRPVEDRLLAFYRDYESSVLTRKWLRLFMYSSLGEGDMAPHYISDIVTQLMEALVEEVAAEKGLPLPADRRVMHEIGWVLHGTISHYAIRRHLYHASDLVPPEQVIRLHVTSFLAGFEATLAAAQAG